ncbi:MAG: tellurite resistance TerB family protein [Bacteroidetes bacterium]|nr:tellurite resistance TerB family protein [Bacteroidota bacterium]
MEKIKFKKLLFDIACSAVTCDGHIDDREIRELQYIDKSTTYFEDIDMSRKLNRFIENFKSDPEETINNIIDKLKELFLNPVEEMLVLEIVLRLVYADTKIDEREIKYLQLVRSCLSMDDELISQRFGVIDFLINTKENIVTSKEKSEDRIKSVDMTNLENMYFSLGEKKEKK